MATRSASATSASGACTPPATGPSTAASRSIDHTRAEEPWLVLTGDSLFVGDAARPDLAVGGVEGATALYASLGRLLELPDGVEVYPGHVSGSLCGKGMSSKGSSTIGFERRFNPMLAFSELSAFVAESASVDAPKPPNLAHIVATNHGPFLPARNRPSRRARACLRDAAARRPRDRARSSRDTPWCGQRPGARLVLRHEGRVCPRSRPTDPRAGDDRRGGRAGGRVRSGASRAPS